MTQTNHDIFLLLLTSDHNQSWGIGHYAGTKIHNGSAGLGLALKKHWKRVRFLCIIKYAPVQRFYQNF